MKDGKINKKDVLFEDKEKKIGFGILDSDDYLIILEGRFIEVSKNKFPLIGLLPLLQLDSLILKKKIEEKGLVFYDVVPVEKILLTAFDDRFSLFWKEVALDWIVKLKYNSPQIVSVLLKKSSIDSNLPKDFKFRIKKAMKQIEEESR